MNQQEASWLRRSAVPIGIPEETYRRFGLTQNPFPNRPTVVRDSEDPRLNGTLYEPKLREQEQFKFERLMVPGLDQPETRPIGFLMDYATRRGRGIGKTAFLNYQCRRIMSDLGNELTDSTYVMFAAYISPPSGGRSRKFWQFMQQIAEALNEQFIIAQAIWRLRAFSGRIPDDVLTQIGSDPQATIGNDLWLEQKGINVMWDLDRTVERKLQEAGVRDEIAHALASSGHDPVEWQRVFLSQQTDYRWRRQGGQLVFDDLVCLFQAAEFNRGLLLVDQVENVVVPQNQRERRAFVEEIRYFFVDGPHQNTRIGFYGLLLTIHPYLQELLVSHWNAVGLDRVCQLSGGMATQYTIYFEPLPVEVVVAVSLVTAYMNEYRTSADLRGQLTPFDQDAVVEALRLAGGVPGPMLTLLRRTLEEAVENDWKSIGIEQIRSVFETHIPSEPEEVGVGEELPPPRVDLSE